jgi:D-alanyl-D-alanine carboxypeptidase
MPRPRSLLTRGIGGAVAALVACSAFLLSSGRGGAAELPPPKASIVVDAGSGAVLAGDHVHDALRPASLAKIMTALVAVERLAPAAGIPVSPLAAGQPAMSINMKAGQTWPFEQAIASLMMVSANDAAYALAEDAGGGSLDRFATIANATARRLGLRDSTLGDPAGLDDSASYKGGPMMSAYDIAVATRNALTVPVIAQYAAMRSYEFVDPTGLPRHLPNHNQILPGDGFGYAGATGFKTGFTHRAGHALVATATRGGRTCIAVILGAAGLGYTDAAHLLDQCFASPVGARGTGERLPDVKISPYDSRIADRQAFAALASDSSGSAADAVDAATPMPAAAAAPIAARPTSKSKSTVTKASGTSPHASSNHHHSEGILSVRNLLVVLVLVLTVVVALRRRVVKHQRMRRLARKRHRAAQMRSGGLPVVDGRYRPGTRIGKPLESHVRIHRLSHDDGEPRRNTG